MPWLGWTCGECRYCLSGRENLCDRARFTGYDVDGGYAELAVADERFCFPIPEGYPDEQAAPLLCAGLIGYRALRLVGDAERIGFYGFGASAHILCQVAVHQGRRVFAFTRAGDEEAQAFARELGAEWAGSSDAGAAGGARRRDRLRPGRRADDDGAARQRQGRADHQRRHPHERHPAPSPTRTSGASASLGSVANLTRQDGEEFMALAPRVPVRTEVEVVPAGGRERGPRRDPQRPPPRRRRPQRRNCIKFSVWQVENLMQFVGQRKRSSPWGGGELGSGTVV